MSKSYIVLLVALVCAAFSGASAQPATIAATAIATADLSTLVAALTAADLVDTFQVRSITSRHVRFYRSINQPLLAFATKHSCSVTLNHVTFASIDRSINHYLPLLPDTRVQSRSITSRSLLSIDQSLLTFAT
jgi:hypothetical protein